MFDILRGGFGLAVLVALTWALSENRRAVRWRVVGAGVALQLILAALLLKIPAARELFAALNQAVAALQQATQAGTSFVFGYLGGGPAPFDTAHPANGFILAFQALPLVLIVSALSALLFYWRILPKVVAAFAWLLERAMGIGGALGLGAAANIFVGMTEAPLLIRPYLARLDRAELFALMSCGMATVAGTVMVLYAGILTPVLPDAMGHILTASLISAPAALLVAHLLIPAPADAAPADLRFEAPDHSAMDAVTRGTIEGVQLLINIVAMLVVFIALIHIANALLGLGPSVGGVPLTLERIFGWVMAPLVWLIGVPWSEAQNAGALMGIKTVLNELIAYLRLASPQGAALSPHTRIIMTYALCGFANFGSLGIMIGGLGVLVPERRSEVAQLGMKSILAGTIATLMTGAVAGMFI